MAKAVADKKKKEEVGKTQVENKKSQKKVESKKGEKTVKKTETKKVGAPVKTVSKEKKVVNNKKVDVVESASEAKKKGKIGNEFEGESPKTMDELLEAMEYTLSAPKPGQVISGLITDVSKRMVLIDIGAKTEGMVVDREFEAAKDFIDELVVGDEVSAYVLTPENERGQILLSLKRALVDRKWEQYAQYMETGEMVEVEGLEVNKGGMIVMAEAIRGFVPSSQFGKAYLGNMNQLLNNKFKVKVIEVDKEKNRLIFSERHVSEADAIAMKSMALQYISEGDEYEGVISGIMPFGVFVGVEVPLVRQTTGKTKKSDAEVGKVEGLVHISEISWEKVNDPNDYFTLGDRVKVKVLGIDEGAGKLNLSVKQLTQDPWSVVADNYPLGAKVKGKVTRTAPFGAFVTLEPGVDGLIHISKIPAGSEPKAGDEIEVFVESVDPGQRRMSLGMVLKEVPVMYK